MFYFKPPIKTLCFQTSREDFLLLLFYSLCHSHQSLVHSDGHPFESSLSFMLPLVRACSYTLPVHPAMFLSPAIYSFPLFYPKGDSFSLVFPLQRPNSCVFRIPPLIPCSQHFRKLPLYPPPLLQLKTGCVVHGCPCNSTLHF